MKIFSPQSGGAQTKMVRPHNNRREVCQDSAPGKSEEEEKEEEIGRQYRKIEAE